MRRAPARPRSPALPRSPAPPRPCPSATRALDAVTIAQAFHWFDADRAFAELAPRRAPRRRRRPHLERPRSIGRLGRRAVVDHGPRREARAVAGPRALVRQRARRPPRLRTAGRGGVPPQPAARRAGRGRSVRVGQPRRRAPRRPSVPRCSTRSARCSRRTPTPGAAPRSRSPTASTPTGASGRREPSVHRSRSRPAAPPAGSRASRGRGQGATISGRVMNAIAPDLLAELARRSTRRDRLGDERQDDHDAAPRRVRSARTAARS